MAIYTSNMLKVIIQMDVVQEIGRIYRLHKKQWHETFKTIKVDEKLKVVYKV